MSNEAKDPTPSTALVGTKGPEVPAGEASLALARKITPLSEAGFGELMLLAKELVPTGFLPEHIKTPGQAVAIILTGRELGMPPMRALRSLMLVKGKVTEAADSILARFKSDGGRATFVKLTETEAVLKLVHRNGDEHTETFTLADADRAGLTRASSRGEPSMYSKHPKAMLRSRVITAGLKSIGWEGGAGTYDPDELQVTLPTGGPVEPLSTEETKTATATREEEPIVVETIEQALNLVVPGGPSKWGGNGGKRFSEVKPSILKAIYKWAAKIIEDEGGEGREPEPKVVAWKKGAELVLKALPPKDPIEDGMKADAARKAQPVAPGNEETGTIFTTEEEDDDDDLPF